jgi:hypothetical protein
MTYETYAFLKGLLDKQMEQLHHEYVVATDFIPPERPKDGQKSGVEKAHDVYVTKRHKLIQMQVQLQDAVRTQYADHPDLEMRKFWGIPV